MLNCLLITSILKRMLPHKCLMLTQQSCYGVKRCKVHCFISPSCLPFAHCFPLHTCDSTASFSEDEVTTTFEPDTTSEPEEEVGPSGACADWKKDFKSCGSACPPLCQDPSGSRPCARQCIAGCFCRNPYVLSDGDNRDSSCIAQNQCPRVDPFGSFGGGIRAAAPPAEPTLQLSFRNRRTSDPFGK